MVHFILGTEAELIKMFPIMLEMKKRKLEYRFIGTGQHDLDKSEILKLFGLKKPDYMISRNTKLTSMGAMLSWFFRILFGYDAKKALPFGGDHNGTALVHGDTISTLLGTLLAKRSGLKVAHVEAGLRSFNLLRPFPEETTRVLVSRFADIAFCPNAWAMNNLRKRKRAIKINTYENTLSDSLRKVIAKKADHEVFKKLPARYFVFVLHRQENLFSRKFIPVILDKVVKASEHTHCVFILHKLTELALESMGLLEGLRKNPGIRFVSRLPYAVFTRLLASSNFIITDGGSNQEESYYLGKPCLVVRKETERTEGLGHNAVLSRKNIAVIDNFMNHIDKYRKPRAVPKINPAKIIVDTLVQKTAR